MTNDDTTFTQQQAFANDKHDDEKSPRDVEKVSKADSLSPSPSHLYEDGELDPVYYEKTLVLNRAIQELGMGKYQYWLFIVAGFGWFADSVWPLITGLILTPVVDEFNFNPPFLSLAANTGLLVGAIFWGLGCDIWGRRWCFNITLFLAGAFGLAAGGSPNLITLASLLAVMGVGVGDLVPASHQYFLTFMSVFWCLGQLLVNLLAWPLIANFSCSFDSSTCQRKDNMGWRYLLFMLGGITLLLWGARFFLFKLLESPRYLIGKGRDEEAVAVIHKVAQYNGKTSSLTKVVRSSTVVFKSNFLFQIQHIKALFRTRKIAFSTSLLVSIWGLIGLASTLYNNFLPFLLASRGAHFGDSSLNILIVIYSLLTVKSDVHSQVIGVPSAFVATWLVQIPQLGRRGALAASAAATGAFLFATTTARSSNALLGWNCGYTFWSNIMYGILYAISPEIFPAKDRGTGNGLTAAATRVFGLIAPIIALYANLDTAVPVWISGALIIFAGSLALLLPYEPRGKASM
ncbi:major facilitator superfamily domain-containing protein [Gymnopilus junonius]|uniref:Major facilitator superfamily domain-containing protein n=1 Tax=Gymnopilus junonius TaxID=109634 RepID=A0A9P5N733_GYMJU|nr:major facilitator superfamily domain-containing protein [Gymnopilus junonius]